MRRSVLQVLVVALGLVLGSPARLAAQDVDVEALRAAVAAAPADPRPRCELAFGLARAGRHREAVDEATVAIDALRARTDRASKRVLAACLYNRGRGHEGAGEQALAVADYADSLDLRPNDAVRARLTALVPDAPAASPLAAVAATLRRFEFAPGVEVASVRTRDRIGWLFAPSGRGEDPTVVAVARICGVPRVAEIARAYFDNYGSLNVESAAARRLGALDAAVVQISGTGDATCHQMEGVMDFRHEATAVVFAEGCRIRVATFVTQADVCEEDRPRGLAVRFDRAGNATTTARPRHAPSGELGIFALRDIAE